MGYPIVRLFYDLETTGTDYKHHIIVQFSGIVDIDGEVIEEIDILCRPHPKAKIKKEALHVIGKTEQELRNYMPQEQAFNIFRGIIDTYINRFDKNSKMYLIGFNNLSFDDNFLRLWFDLNNDSFYAARFWPGSIDTMSLASQHFIGKRDQFPHFKLRAVARALGINVINENLHNASYDVELTREIYYRLT